jgi:hypothetical protein
MAVQIFGELLGRQLASHVETLLALRPLPAFKYLVCVIADRRSRIVTVHAAGEKLVVSGMAMADVRPNGHFDG